MTTAIQEKTPDQKRSALLVMANKFHVEPKQLLSTLKDTAFRGATDSQMMALCVVANEYGLNPFTKEIYAFPDKKGGGIVPVISCDGWYRIANDHDQFDGCELIENNEDGRHVSTTCRIYRKDRSHPVEITEFLDECKRNSEPWNKQPKRMLRHRAFIQCARVAFGMSVADPEDAERMAEYQKSEPVKANGNPFKQEEPLAAATVEVKPAEIEEPAETGDGADGDFNWEINLEEATA